MGCLGKLGSFPWRRVWLYPAENDSRQTTAPYKRARSLPGAVASQRKALYTRGLVCAGPATQGHPSDFFWDFFAPGALIVRPVLLRWSAVDSVTHPIVRAMQVPGYTLAIRRRSIRLVTTLKSIIARKAATPMHAKISQM